MSDTHFERMLLAWLDREYPLLRQMHAEYAHTRKLSSDDRPRRYGRWITLGAREDAEGVKRGGSRVYIENGRITKGAPSLTGKKLGAMHEPAEGQSVRAANKTERDYQVARTLKDARQQGIHPEEVRALAGDILAHDAELHGLRKEMLAEARSMLGMFSDPRALHLGLQSGRVDSRSIRGLDLAADHLKQRYPHAFPPDRHAEDVLAELLTHGAGERLSHEDAYRQALDTLTADRDSYRTRDDEEVPFGKEGLRERYSGWAEPPQPWESRASTGESITGLPKISSTPKPKPVRPAAVPVSFDPAAVPGEHTHVVDVSGLPAEVQADVHRRLGHLPRMAGVPGGYLVPPGVAPSSLLGEGHPANVRKLTQALRKEVGDTIAAFRAAHIARVDLSRMTPAERAEAGKKLAGLKKLPGADDVYEVPGGTDLKAVLGRKAEVRHLFATQPYPGTGQHRLSGEPPSSAGHARPVHPLAAAAERDFTHADALAAHVERPAHGTAPRPLKVGPLRLSAGEAGTTLIPLLYNDRLPPSGRKMSLADIARYLNRRSLQALGGRPVEWDTHASRESAVRGLGRVMAAETLEAVARKSGAVKWYKQSLRNALAVAALTHPELAHDEFARTAFVAALAITSNGNSIGANARDADAVYRLFKAHGRMPENYGKGPTAGAWQNGFRTFNDLLAGTTPRRLIDFLRRELTVRELREAGHNVSGENADTPVVGAMVLGPKIGNGFFSNLLGDYSRLTMDRWFMRTFNRYAGRLVNDGPVLVEASLQRFRRALHQAGNAALALQADESALLRAAKQTYDAYQSGGFRDRSEVNRAAKGLMETLFKPNEAPESGSHRAFMRDGASEALHLVHTAGHRDVETADMQALLWYPEKDLYEKLGYNVSRAASASYDAAFRQIARQSGVDKGKVRRAGDGRQGASEAHAVADLVECKVGLLGKELPQFAVTLFGNRRGSPAGIGPGLQGSRLVTQAQVVADTGNGDGEDFGKGRQGANPTIDRIDDARA